KEAARQRPITIALLATLLRQANEPTKASELLRRARAQHPAEFCLNLALGIACLPGDSWESERYLHLCAIERPTNASVRTALGLVLFENEYVDDAENELREAIRLAPSYAEPHLQLAGLLQAAQQPMEAEAEFRQAMRLNPWLYAPPEKLLALLAEQNKLAEADRALHEAVDRTPEAAPAYLCLADLLARQSKWSEAHAVYQQAVRLDHRAAKRARSLTLAFLGQDGAGEAARHLMTVLEADPDDHLLAMQTAILQLQLGNHQAHADVCRRLLARYRDTKDPLEADRTAKACLCSIPPVGELEELTRLAQVAVTEGKSHSFYCYFPLVRALAAYRAGDWPAALQWSAEGLHLVDSAPNLRTLKAHYLVVKAMAQHRSGDPGAAIVTLESAQSIINILYPEAPKKLGVMWADWSLYDILRKEAVQFIPVLSSDGGLNEKFLAATRGDWDLAAQGYSAAVRSDPEDDGSALRAAVLHLYLHHQSEYQALARQMLERSGPMSTAITAHRTSFACLLASPPVGAMPQLEELAELASNTGGETRQAVLLYGRGRGLAAYRAGRWEEAIKWCNQSRGDGQGLTQSINVPMQDMLIEAMALHHLGKTADAQQRFDQAEALIQEQFPGPSTSIGKAWFDWLVYQILRREAEPLLKGGDAKPPDSR
ncbi:MAG TPA: tetratricopeptide repeat protein, partial [Pirellulaceae bacterium]|nr:tetratricopeptide repeat protein [Pirellulaceae bacterium]